MTITCEPFEIVPQSKTKPKRVSTEADRARTRLWIKNNQEHVKAYRASYYAKNGDILRAKARKKHADDPSYQKSKSLKNVYGITLKDRDRLFASQGNKCAICGSKDSQSKYDWHTDHCHTSGVVRGVLCHPCNIMLGSAKDDIEVLSSAISYLQKDFEVQEWRMPSVAIN